MKIDELEKYYYTSLLIRKFEEEVENLFSQGKLVGTTHGCIGQEIIAAILLDFIDIKKDSVTGTHRSHGHYLALFKDPESLFCELMGKENGVVKGKGGSQHLYRDNFYTNGITGGMVPVATGIAMVEKLKKSDNIVLSFFGDGAMNEGYVFEAFNFSLINNLPILYILENNQYAMSTYYKKVSAGNFTERLKSLSMKTYEANSIDIEQVLVVSVKAVKYVRENKKPAFINFKTYRFCGHSRSDKCEYRTREEENYWKDNDPIVQMEKISSKVKIKKIKQEIKDIIEQAVKRSEKDKYTNPLKIYKEKCDEIY